ncbi:unnamed protein product [Paramecium pentaurelia]|uniref:Uncharacterized protein n=1 Tax=Paramecium pentaurelia TaxID=43138 RepID=A0A8S1VK60_9CILI|nr:unnamed protein product [Paramecium pentaurelia]
MFKNNYQLKSSIIAQLLNHLNSNCSYGNVFESKIIGDPQNPIFSIVLRQSGNSISLSQSEMIQQNLDELFNVLPRLCIKQIEQVKDVIIPNSFQVQISLDYITKSQISMPFKILNSDKLILCPLFCDFQVFLEKMLQSSKFADEIINIDSDEYYVISLMWKIRNLLNNLYKNQASFEFILYPKKHNFGICKQQNNTEVLYFHSLKIKQKFLQQNSKFCRLSTTIYEALKKKQIIETQINLSFLVDGKLCCKELDIEVDYSQYLFQIDFEKEEEENVKLWSQQIQINDQKHPKYINDQKHPIKQPIIIKNPILCQSTLCLNNDIENDIQHFIKFEKNINPKCQCGRELDPYSGDTLIIDYKLMKAFNHIIQDLLLQIEEIGLQILLYPLYMEVEKDEYDNYFIVLFIKEYNQKKLKLKSHFFEGPNQNYNLHLIEDKNDEKDYLDKLLGEEEIYNKSDEQLQEKSDYETKMTIEK